MSEQRTDPKRLRQYYYVSPRKVIQLGDQIQPSRWRRLCDAVAELEVTTPVAGVGVRLTPREQRSRATTVNALQAVFKKLTTEHHVHTLDEDALVLHGVLDMYFGLARDPRTKGPVAIWVGATERSILAIGGSPENMWGGGSDQPGARSQRPPVPEPEVFASLREADDDRARLHVERTRPGKSIHRDVEIKVAKLYRDWRLNNAGKSRYEVLVQQQRRTKLRPPHLDTEMDIVIGSPIFVAAAV